MGNVNEHDITITWGDGKPSPVDSIIALELSAAIALFRSKARDYSERSGVFTADLLGAQGQFAEIWRKIPKLKKGMWDGEQLENESVREILQDIIGHCLLALDFESKKEDERIAAELDAKRPSVTLQPPITKLADAERYEGGFGG